MSKSLRLPRENHFELQKTSRDPGALTILTSQIVLARRRGANFGDLSFQKCSEPVFNDFDFHTVLARKRGANFGALSVFNNVDFQIALARRRGANFRDLNFQKCSEPLSF